MGKTSKKAFWDLTGYPAGIVVMYIFFCTVYATIKLFMHFF